MSNSNERDLNDIAVFAAVVEARSFTKAGKELGMPRSSVSRRVAQLEKRLGVRLLHRTTRSVRLTEVGAEYYERCRESLAAIDQAEAMVQEAQATPRGRLRITAPSDIGNNYLAPLIVDFTERYPDVQVDIFLTQRVVDLVGEGFDAALRAGNLSDSTLIARRLGGGERRLVASPDYVKRRGMPETPNRLGEHCCILANDKPAASWTLRCGNKTVEIPVQGPLRVNDFAFARIAAIRGAGIANLPDFLCTEELNDGRLLAVLPDHRAATDNLYLVYPSAKHLSAALRAFRDFVLEDERLPRAFSGGSSTAQIA